MTNVNEMLKGTAKALLFLFIAISLPACGKRGPLIPPEALAPAPISDLKVSQKGESFFLSWSAPTRDDAGRPLQDLAGFRLFSREVRPAGEDCEECADSYRLRADLDLDYLTGAFRHGNFFFFIDQDIPPGLTRQYMIISYKRDGMISAASNKVRRVKASPPPAPRLTAISTPTTIQLKWENALATTQPVVGYNIYRKTQGEEFFPPLPLNVTPIKESRYEDIGLERKEVYSYAVRAVIAVDDGQLEGALSNEATASLTALE